MNIFKKAVLLFTIISFSAQAQNSGWHNFEKGKYLLSLYGTGGLSTSYNSWALTPSVGYFTLPNLLTGVQVSYGKYESKEKAIVASAPQFSHHSFAPELFVRYYAPKIKIKPFVQASAGYNIQWGENESPTKEKVSGSNAVGSLSGGVMFPLGRRLSLDVMYNWRAFSKSALSDPKNGKSLSLGFSFAL